MNGFEVLIPLFGILLVLVPVTGLTFVLTARFALGPLVDKIAKALHDLGSPQDAQGQLRDLSEQVQLLSEQVARLEQTQEFDRKLLGAHPEEPLHR